MCDVPGQLASMAYSHVTPEPVVREQGTGSSDGGGLVCDLAVRGVWNPQTQVLFYFKTVNTDAHSYVNRPVRADCPGVCSSNEEEQAQGSKRESQSRLHPICVLNGQSDPSRRPAFPETPCCPSGHKVGHGLFSRHELRSSTNVHRNSSGIDPLHSGCQEKVLFAHP